MNRRFLMTFGLGFAAVCGVTGWRFIRSNQESALINIIYKKLGYLKLDDDGVRKFAHDQSLLPTISKARLHMIDAAGPLYTHLGFAGNDRFDIAVRHGEDRVVTQYLLSTDFFRNGADQTRVVNYLGYYNPMVACNNPFARPPIIPDPA
jgi:hypothetical protein